MGSWQLMTVNWAVVVMLAAGSICCLLQTVPCSWQLMTVNWAVVVLLAAGSMLLAADSTKLCLCMASACMFSFHVDQTPAQHLGFCSRLSFVSYLPTSHHCPAAVLQVLCGHGPQCLPERQDAAGIC